MEKEVLVLERIGKQCLKVFVVAAKHKAPVSLLLNLAVLFPDPHGFMSGSEFPNGCNCS